MTFITLDHIMELQQCYYVNVNALMSQTLAMMVEAEARLIRKLWDWSETEPKIRLRQLVCDRGSGLSRPRRAKKLPRGKTAASRTTSLSAAPKMASRSVLCRTGWCAHWHKLCVYRHTNAFCKTLTEMLFWGQQSQTMKCVMSGSSRPHLYDVA